MVVILKIMDTRSSSRINVNLKIISKVPQDPKQKFSLVSGVNFEANAFDISSLGVGVFSKYYLPKDLVLELSMDGPTFGLEEDLKTQGRVTHCSYSRNHGYRCGIEFLGLPEGYIEAINRFISAREKRNAPRMKLEE
ncbi:MAG: PilZ domain-containing protein [Candidatus Omnitrophota bacterium]